MQKRQKKNQQRPLKVAEESLLLVNSTTSLNFAQNVKKANESLKVLSLYVGSGSRFARALDLRLRVGIQPLPGTREKGIFLSSRKLRLKISLRTV
jgi:hypothetical protein